MLFLRTRRHSVRERQSVPDYGHQFMWIWIESFVFSILSAPAIMIWKDQYPWVVSVAIGVGAAAIIAGNAIAGAVVGTNDQRARGDTHSSGALA
jgi:hypothetical protein